MIKKSLLIACGISLCLGHLMAATVPVQKAQTVAVNFYKGNVSASAVATPTLVYTRSESDGIVDYYVFNIAPRGFVIVTGDDDIQPVIGYSGESDFRMGFEHTGIQDWTDHAAEHIHRCVLSGVSADGRISGLWSRYLSGPSGPGSRSAVAPLTTTTWDQSPYYNDMCPLYVPDNQRAVTGCVATSMAQIMKHWNYPTTGQGSFTYTDSISQGYSANYGVFTANFGATTYAWSSMPNSINSANSAIATLMFHCGVSVGMDYGDNNQGGSGAWVIQAEAGGPTLPCSEYAYRHYFKYDTTTLQGLQEANYSSAQWIALLKADLDAGRPIQYEGDDLSAGGHAWVCDGYDANDMLHMNWGWSGSSDGYFAVNTLNAGGYNFNQNEGALIGIQPPPPFRVTAQAAATTVCHGTSTQLTATGPASATYTWTPTAGVTCASCATTSVSPTATTVYTAIGDSAGVQVRSSVLVTVAPGITAAFTAPVVRACTAPADFTFANSSQYADHYSWNFGDGTTLSTDTNPTHTYTAYGTYPVQLRVTGSCGTDSVIKTSYITVSDLSPSVTGTLSICNGTSATLIASAANGASVSWYDTDAGGTVLDTNIIFHTPPIVGTTTYYMEAAIPGPAQGVGPSSYSFGTGGNFANTNGHALVFDCHKPQKLVSVDVNAQGAGVRTIRLLDSYGDTLQSADISIPSGQSTVTLNFDLPVATNLLLQCSGNINLYRNQSGAVYPYYSADSSVVITAADVSGPYYYFFYNWKLQAPACTSARVPAVVSVMNGSATFTNQNNGLAVSFAPTVTTATTYQWSFGDGATSTDQNASHTYAASGVYTVQLIESNGSCSDTTSQQISAIATGITDVSALSGIFVYPIPSHDAVSIRVNAAQAIDAEMIITDMVGHVVAMREVKLSSGTNTLRENIAAYAPGVYFVTLQSGQGKLVDRFVKE